MKAIIASLIVLSSSISFGQTMPLEDSITTFLMACSIEKFCPAGSQTAYDLQMTSNKSVAAAELGGLQCGMVDMVIDMPETKEALKIVATTLPLLDPTFSSCLATIP
jgi:hypothetical protein